jgi:hypothetical protein
LNAQAGRVVIGTVSSLQHALNADDAFAQSSEEGSPAAEGKSQISESQMLRCSRSGVKKQSSETDTFGVHFGCDFWGMILDGIYSMATRKKLWTIRWRD